MKQVSKKVTLAITAALCGLCNALIGAGGGILLTGALSKIKGTEFPDKRDIYVNSQASMIPGCALSCLIYFQKGMLDISGFSLFALPAVIGGIVGSLLLTKVKSNWMQVIFSVLVLWSGARMLIS